MQHAAIQIIGFMYLPAMETLRHLPNSTLHRANDVDVDALAPGSTLVWVGSVYLERVPWGALRARGVRTVHYQSEPMTAAKCARLPQVDEVWDYSWHNIDVCSQAIARPPRIRYVPIAVQSYAPRAEPKLWQRTVTFFGSRAFRNETCPAMLQMAALTRRGWRLRDEYRVWSMEALRAHAANSSGVYVNVLKRCEPTALPAFRYALLLSMGAAVVSQRCYAKDEAEYAPNVLFLDDLRSATTRAVAKHLSQRDLRRWRARFAPRQVLARAGLLP